MRLKYGVHIMALIASFAAGYFFKPMRNQPPQVAEQREGMQHYTNPLLACTSAENVLATPDLNSFKGKIEHLANESSLKKFNRLLLQMLFVVSV